MMNSQQPYLLLPIWYWEGPVSRYYRRVRGWRSGRETTLWLLERGSVVLHWGEGERRVEAGQWILPPPMRRNERFSVDAEVKSLRFLALRADGNLLLNPLEPWVFPVREPDPMEHTPAALREWVVTEINGDPGHKTLFQETQLEVGPYFRLQAIMAEGVAQLHTRLGEAGFAQPVSTDTHPAVSMALRVLAERDLSRPLKEIEVARAAGISLSHLRCLFREQTGFTLKDWDAQRIESGVRHRLRTGHNSMKEIAAEFGFHSPSHFSRWFRQRFGRSPGEFQRLPRSDDLV
ncbi:MAG: AraC family transcriptional regulator [Opitutales bacterium]